MIKSKSFLYLIIALLLVGCGYRPLYATNDKNQGVSDKLSSIDIAEVDSRTGQILRNDLLSTMRPVGTVTPVKYRLTLNPTVVNDVVFDQNRPGINRRRLRLNVTYSLVDLKTGKEVTKGSSFSYVSYDEIHQPIADMQAETNATERAANEVAIDIKTKLAAFASKKA